MDAHALDSVSAGAMQAPGGGHSGFCQRTDQIEGGWRMPAAFSPAPPACQQLGPGLRPLPRLRSIPQALRRCRRQRLARSRPARLAQPSSAKRQNRQPKPQQPIQPIANDDQALLYLLRNRRAFSGGSARADLALGGDSAPLALFSIDAARQSFQRLAQIPCG